MVRRGLFGLLAIAVVGTLLTVADAEDSGWDVGFRGIALIGNGVPANDMLGSGLALRRHWRGEWYFGLGLDAVDFDYERPNELLGIGSTAEIDGSFDFSRISGWIERRYDEQDFGWSWFWTAGIGFADVGTELVRGFTPTGGMWEIDTDATSEVHILLSAGVRRHLGERFILEATAHLEHFTTDYQLVDRISGVRGSVGSQTPEGVSFGLAYRF